MKNKKEDVIIKNNTEKNNSTSNHFKIEKEDVNTLKDIKSQINSNINTEGKSVNFHQIQFLKDEDQILKETEVYLEEVVKILNEIPKLKLSIIGHTSSEGDENYNLKLSERRAIAVSNFLQKKGIDASRLKTRGEGSNKPIVQDSDENSRAINRRIEFLIIEDGVDNK